MFISLVLVLYIQLYSPYDGRKNKQSIKTTVFTCLCKKSFYQGANTSSGKIGRLASEEVVLQIIKRVLRNIQVHYKCIGLPILLLCSFDKFSFLNFSQGSVGTGVKVRWGHNTGLFKI